MNLLSGNTQSMPARAIRGQGFSRLRGAITALSLALALITVAGCAAKQAAPAATASPAPAAEAPSGEMEQPMPRASSAPPGSLQQILEDCKQHPAVTHGGQTVQGCMEAAGYIPSGDTWVPKPAYR